MKETFYQRHLDQVSRSFAFCIEQLEMPLREWVGLSYLLCRIADTIEDSPWTTLSAQAKGFQDFLRFMREPQAESQIEAWWQSFPQDIPSGERDLLKVSAELFSDLRALPDTVRKPIQTMLEDMVYGMEHFCRLRHFQTHINSLKEANQYCFFVAGIIGELLTRLVAIGLGPEFQITQRLLINGCHMGLYLQKINLLKDQKTDESEGRFLVNSRDQLQESLLTNAHHALEYIQSLPVAARGYRTFCAWSLFLGLASLPFIERSWAEQKPIKISREETWTLLAQIQSEIDDNKALTALFQRLKPNLGPLSSKPKSTFENEAWFRQAYHGALADEGLKELGVISR